MPKRRRREGAWQRRNKVLQSVCIYIYPLDYINCLAVCLAVCLFFLQKTNDHSEGSGGEPGVRGAGYTPIVKENDRFVKYYQVCQKLLFVAFSHLFSSYRGQDIIFLPCFHCSQAPPCRLPLFLLHLQCSSTLPSLYSSVTRFVSLFFSLSRTNFSSHMSALFVSHL